ncbi:MAG: hypothetical protein ACI89D_002151 [Bermanella sp.]|jgi:hypothetical protein
MRFLKQPLLHFIVIGMLLFAGSQHLADRQRQSVEALDEETVKGLRDDWMRQTGRVPSSQQMLAMQKQELESRMLFAEALRRNYHRDDTVVLQRLLRDAEFLGMEGSDEDKIRTAMSLGVHLSDEVIKRRMVQRIERIGRLKYVSAPVEAQLQTLYETDRERWLVPARYSFRHIFYSADRPENPQQRALGDLAIVGAADSITATAMGDPFLHGQDVSNKSLQDMTFMFGAQFSDALGAENIASDHWFGPLPSAYGQHLLRVSEIYPEHLRNFAAVKPKLVQLWRDGQERQSLRLYIDELRERYVIAALDQPSGEVPAP